MTQSKKSTSTFKEDKPIENKRKFVPDPLLNRQDLKVFKKLVLPVNKAK